ncbi:MAG: iron-containing alcohol dehydrogenase [Solobacterium sp.]|nr:iron-containing alcohol dehydrogenase [Solobacterium sp.]
MNNFIYYAPTKVVFGKDTQLKVGELLKENHAKKVLIHYGSERIVKDGLFKQVTDCLEAMNISYVSLGGVVSNPRLSLVRKGIEFAKQEQIDFILAIGGGSVIDSAKAIAYGYYLEEDIWDVFDKKVTPTKCLPIGAILTIAAAGSEMSGSSVITNDETKDKRGYRNNLARLRFVIMNPALTISVSDYTTQAGCVDIMMHTMERYFTNGSKMDLTDEFAEGLLRTVKHHALILHEDPANYESRAEVMWASSLSHNDLTGCGNDGDDFASHSLEHELSALYDVSHGAGLAAIWGSWARYVYKDCLPRFVKFAKNVMLLERNNNESDEEYALRGIEALENFFRSLNMPTSIKELGVEASDEDLQYMAHHIAEVTGGHRGSAKVLYEEDFLNIYRLANH